MSAPGKDAEETVLQALDQVIRRAPRGELRALRGKVAFPLDRETPRR